MIPLERVARAICKADGDDWNREGNQGGLMEVYGPLARAAVKAFRTPSAAMIEAGARAIHGTPDEWDALPAGVKGQHRHDARAAFRAMIDVILVAEES